MAIQLADVPEGCRWAAKRLARVECGDADVILATDADLPAESYRLQRRGETVTVAAADEAGWHDGLLELAQRLRHGRLRDGDTVEHRPRFDFRAFKFNLPWNPYRLGEAMTRHQDVCRDPAFWERLLDHLALCRFNVLSLWNLLPFPWMVRVPGFPEANPGDDAELQQWEDLWRAVFRMARERQIRPVVMWWTIFVPPHLEDAWGVDYSDGEYHIGPGVTDERIERYNRDAVTALIDTYHDLAGVGVCMGERMQNMTPAQQRAWIERTVYPGVKAAKRPVLFVQRASLKADAASVREMIERADLPGEVVVEYKFNWSHGHSTPQLAMTHGSADRVDDGLWNPPPTRYRMAWMVRNEDFFVLRWGEPDFIRAHVVANGHDHVAGYFVGSEGQIPALELAEKLPADQRGWDYAFERQWLFSTMWGRLLFDPQTPDAAFAEAFDERYGPGVGETMVQAYRLAGRMPLRLASFHAVTWDYTLYAEGFLAPFKSLGPHDGRPFISIDELIDHRTLDPRLMAIAPFAAGEDPAGRVTPLELAAELDHDSGQLADLLSTLQRQGGGRPAAYACELDDLEAWLHLTRYFAAKLLGGVALARHRQSSDPAQQAQAVEHLERGVSHWRALAEVTARRYHRVPYIGRPAEDYRLDFHWQDYLPEVEADVAIAHRG